MKLNSVAGVVYYVTDIAKTVKFYTDLGFLAGQREDGYASVRLNWFWVDFYQDKHKKINGAGVLLGIKVDDVDAFYKGAIAKGFKPESEPTDRPRGKREFVLKDPDGYELLFFSKK